MTAVDPVPSGPPGCPSDVLERIILQSLKRSPCVVAFSGGRDSSAVLALAVQLARHHALPLPIPATRVFLDNPEADETSWQTSIIRYLRLDDWVRVPLRDECDLIGPMASSLLWRHGLLWPPAVYTLSPLLEIARGGVLLTGEGGDEVFGPRRVAPVRHLLGGARRFRAALPHLRGAIGFSRSRTRYWEHRLRATSDLKWLLPATQSALHQELVRERVQEPLWWKASTLQLPLRRGWVHGAATMQHLAHEYGVQMCHPLLEPEFLTALAESGQFLGPMTRAEGLRDLFGEVLPAEIIRRQSKASFNSALVGEASRQFAAGWQGDGIDTRLVNHDSLQQTWLGEFPHACSFALLQAAWMAQRGWPLEGRVNTEEPRAMHPRPLRGDSPVRDFLS